MQLELHFCHGSNLLNTVEYNAEDIWISPNLGEHVLNPFDSKIYKVIEILYIYKDNPIFNRVRYTLDIFHATIDD